MAVVSIGPDALLDALFQASSDAMVVFETMEGGAGGTPSIRLLRANRAGESLPDHLSVALREQCIRAIEARQRVSTEAYYQEEGRAHWMRLNATPQGHLVVGTVTDITPTREAQHALADLQTALEETRREAERQHEVSHAANEAKSRFLATMSHELR